MPHPPGRYAERMKKLPKGLSLREVQRALGIKTKGQASRVCSRYRYKLPHRGNPLISKNPRWQAVDWKLQDIAIAEMMGVSRERVRKVRLRLGKPKPKNHGRQRGVSWDDGFGSLEQAIRQAI